MTVPASTVPAAIAYLVTHITSQIGDTNVYVTYGPPGPYEPPEIVSVGQDIIERTVVRNAFVGSGQAGWLQESYVVDVVVQVYRGGTDFQGTLERAASLIQSAETAIRNDPTLGGLVEVAFPSVGRFVPEWSQEHQGPMVTATLEVTVETTI